MLGLFVCQALETQQLTQCNQNWLTPTNFVRAIISVLDVSISSSAHNRFRECAHFNYKIKHEQIIRRFDRRWPAIIALILENSSWSAAGRPIEFDYAICSSLADKFCHRLSVRVCMRGDGSEQNTGKLIHRIGKNGIRWRDD